MAKRKVLIVGSDSAIGRALFQALALSNDFQVDGTSRRGPGARTFQLDLARPIEENSIINKSYDAAVICAGVTSIAKCESSVTETRLLNVASITNVATRLMRNGSHIIYLSSNLVFNGLVPLPDISDPLSPTTEYGNQKSLVERQLQSQQGKVAIVRLTKVLPRRSPLFSNWIQSLMNGLSIRARGDKFFAPISLESVVKVLISIIRLDIEGVIHVSPDYDVTYLEAFDFVCKNLGLTYPLNSLWECTSESGVCIQTTALKATRLTGLALIPSSPLEALRELTF